MSKVAFLSLAVCLAVATGPASAAIVTIDFTSGGGGIINRVGTPGGTGINTYTENGLLIATSNTSNHLEFFGSPGAGTWGGTLTTGLPWHRGGSNPVDPNVLNATFGGNAFDLISLDVVSNTDGLSFLSSNGGLVNVAAGVTGPLLFSGTGWQNITGFSITILGAGNPAQLHALDNIVLNDAPTVPEPASMLAWGVIAGVGAMGYRLRKRKVVAAA